MTARDQNLLATLNILALVFRSRKHMFPDLTDQQQYTLQITKEHLAQAEITVPILLSEALSNSTLLDRNIVDIRYQSPYNIFALTPYNASFSELLGD